MPQLFPRWLNKLPLFAAIAGLILPVAATAGIWYYGSPKFTDVGYQPVQPVPYSHKLHAGDLGLDCRYCHASVETSAVANIPPTQACMNCHKLVKRDSEVLAPIRDSAATGRPMRWTRVHKLPDFAYFEHRSHVAAGVGCVTCHGRIDEMEVVTQMQPLSMSWCLDCHRGVPTSPKKTLIPHDKVTDLIWVEKHFNELAEKGSAAIPGFDAKRVSELLKLAPPTNCGACHY